MTDIFSFTIRRNGQKEYKAKGSAKDIEESFETWVHKEMGGRKIKWR